jgi:23S rRNA (pseudouridine1915-N3)-methyltransferase
MKLSIVNIGKTQQKYLSEGISEYEKRLKYFIKLEQIFIQETKYGRNIPVEQIKKNEGNKILNIISRFDYLIFLDEKGTEMTSKELAGFFQEKINRNIKNLGIIIGGAYGISGELLQKGDFIWSLSKLTFSHQMIRLFLMEQIYRAFSILNNLPYHND